MSIPCIKNYQTPSNFSEIENRVKWSVDQKKSVLLIHDMQNYFIDFFDKDSVLIKNLLSNIQSLKNLCHALNIPVIYTAQPSKQDPKLRALLSDFWGPGLVDEAQGVQIVDELKPSTQDTSFTKWRYSAFQRTPLHQFMQNQERDQLIICGVYGHIGILSTALEAFMTDIKVFLVGDAIADFSEKDHQWTMNYISQRCGKVESLESISERLLGENRKQLITLDSMKQDISDIMKISLLEIEDDENLLDLGLDSIRLMSLVEKWREQGVKINFSDLAETAILSDWHNILTQPVFVKN